MPTTINDFFGDGSADNVPECSFCGETDGELVVSVSDHYGPTHWHHETCRAEDNARKGTPITPTWDEAMDGAGAMDPRENNLDNYKDGQTVRCTMWDETRLGFVVNQINDRHFLVRLDWPFDKTNPGKQWLTVCRDHAHQSVVEV